MSSAAAENVQTIQKALGPYVRPREEAEHIRRILALNLRSCHENGPQHGPLALADSDCTLKSTDARGLQRDYLKALHANIKAQRDYESVSQTQTAKETRSSASGSSLYDASPLEEHITMTKLKKKQERLQAVEKYLDILGDKPAASPEFLQPEVIFKGAARLPDVPKTVVSSFTVDNTSAKTDLKALVDRLEKAVLRSKLLLKKEELLLDEVKSRSTTSPAKVSDGAKFAALQATKNEMIAWMETELGKAGPGDENMEAEGMSDYGRDEPNLGKSAIEDQVALIKDKYASYVAARKALIQLVAQSPQPSTNTPNETHKSALLEQAAPAPSTHLITPYIASLLAVAHEQKALIAQKSHLSNVVARQMEDSARALRRLAEESQILPDNFTQRRNDNLGGSSSDQLGHEVTSRVQPWVYAADNAKLATLEAVAEKIEEGQIALERSTRHIGEIDQLLGRTSAQGGDEGEDTMMEDMWLAETQSPQKGRTSIKPKDEAGKEPKDVWMTLDGNLGLINPDDSPRR